MATELILAAAAIDEPWLILLPDLAKFLAHFSFRKMALEISSGSGLLSLLFPRQYQRKTIKSNMEATSILPVSHPEPCSNAENEKADLRLLTKIYQYFMNDYYSVDICNGVDQFVHKSDEPLHYEEWEFIDKLFDESTPFPRNEAQAKGILFLMKTMEGFGWEALSDATELMKSKQKELNPEGGNELANDSNNNFTKKLIILIEDPPLTEDRGEFCTVAQILTIGLLACQINPYLIPCSDIDYVVMDKILCLDKQGEIIQADKFKAYSKLIKTVFDNALQKAETCVVILDIDPDVTKMEEFRDAAVKTGYPVVDLTGILFDKSLKRRKLVRDLLHYIADTISKQKSLNASVNQIKDEWKRELYPANNQDISDFKRFQNFNYNELLGAKIAEKVESVRKATPYSEEESMEEFLLALDKKKEQVRDTLQYLQTNSSDEFLNTPKHFVNYEKPKKSQPRLYKKQPPSFCRRIQQYICSCCSVNRVEVNDIANQQEASYPREFRTGAFIYDEGDDLV